MDKNQENFAHRFRDNDFKNNLVKFLHDKIINIKESKLSE